MTEQSTLGELAAGVPGAAKVFFRYGLDYCCGGKQTLAEACAEGGLDAAELLSAIEAEQATSAQGHDGGIEWLDRPLDQLIQHILDRYHAPLRPELGRLVAMASKVERVHGRKEACPRGLAEHLQAMQPFVEDHLSKEEQILFPLILSGRGRHAHMPVQVMLQEHEDHGAALRGIRALTDDLRIPEEACATWRELYRALAQLELELIEHIHLENNVLFPRALAG